MTQYTQQGIQVTKRDGRLEDINIDKIHQVVEWACDGIKGVSASEIVINTKLKFYDKMDTREIHLNLLNTTEELISPETPNYDKVGSRLFNFDIRKKVFGSFRVPSDYASIVNDYASRGVYDELLAQVPDETLNRLWSKVKVDRDYDVSLYGMKQLVTKYCSQSRTDGTLYEIPTMAFFRISLIGAINDSSPENVDEAQFLEYYNQFSKGDNSLPTPIMGGVGTKVRQFSSCVGVDVGDSIESITTGSSAVIKYVTQRAGIGVNLGRIRAIGSPIRNGEVSHTGMIPFVKHMQASVHSCSQGGMRKSAATAYFPLWHYEFPELVVLKDNTLTEENSARHLDYAFTINGFLYQRLLAGKDITLFSPHELDGELYESFASDQKKFADLYEKLEKDPTVRKRVISAEKVFTRMLMMQRKETGRIYIANIDHMNEFGAFDTNKAPIHFSNLCCVVGSERVVSNRGLLTVDTLHEQGGELTLFDGKNPVSASAMELIRESDHVYKVVLKNGITHTITKDHKVMTTNGLLECGDLSIGDSVVLQGEKGLFGETHEPIKAYQCGFECEDVPSFVWVGDEETQSAYFRGIVDSGTPLNEIHEGAKTVFRNLGVSGFNEGSSEIVDIIYMGEEPVYCCEVFTDDHLWTVNGVVTHNCEIALPSKPMQHIDDVLNSEIFLCTLANVNMTAIKSNDHLRRVCRNVVRYLDGLLDFQNYPVAAAEFWGKNRRSLGVGVNNYAHWLARKGLSYGEKEANEATHEWFEAFQYYLILASMELAKEKGACGSFHETKYARGIMPVDAYKKDVDELGDFTYHMDWDWLREQVKEHGMRNSTLTAIPPSETSSTVLPGNSTNGVEMPRNTMVAKTNKDVSGKVLVPEVSKLKNRYSYLWDQESPEGYIKAIAVMQKFIDQAISSNTSYNPDMYEGGDIPMSRMMRDMLLAYKYGLKTLYYNNTKKAASTRKDEEKQALVDEEKERQQHEDDDDEECESCAI